MAQWLLALVFFVTATCVGAGSDDVPASVALVTANCGSALIATTPPATTALVTAGWHLRRLFSWGLNTAGNVRWRASAFASRFPKAKYSRLTNYTAPLQFFFEQVGLYDFRHGPPVVQVKHTVRTEWWFGWFPKRQLYEVNPVSMPLSPVLVDGWRRLGLIADNGQIDFTISPGIISQRFTALTGWTVRRPKSDPDDDAVLRERLDAFLQDVLVADDTFDYLFVMPLLLEDGARNIFKNYASFTVQDLTELFPGKEIEGWRAQGTATIFLQLLAQSRSSSDGVLFSAGPIVLPPSLTTAKEREMAAKNVDDLVAWLAQPDDQLIGESQRNDRIFGSFTSRAMGACDFAPSQLDDWLAVAIAEQLYRVAGIVEKHGFTEQALVFSREKARVLQQYFRGRLPQLHERLALPAPTLALPGE